MRQSTFRNCLEFTLEFTFFHQKRNCFSFQLAIRKLVPLDLLWLTNVKYKMRKRKNGRMMMMIMDQHWWLDLAMDFIPMISRFLPPQMRYLKLTLWPEHCPWPPNLAWVVCGRKVTMLEFLLFYWIESVVWVFCWHSKVTQDFVTK